MLSLFVLVVCQSAVAGYLDILQHSVTAVDSVLEGEALLPCNTTPAAVTEQLQLVLWYRVGSKLPFYTYDARGRPRGHGQHTVDDLLLPLARVNYHFAQSSLVLSGVLSADEGAYMCRVEYLHSPPATSLIHLTVTVPAQSVKIYDHNGSLLKTKTPPTPLNHNLILSCEAAGGRPAPNVTWLLAARVIDSSYVATASGLVRNELVLRQLRRQHHGAVLTCTASSGDTAAAARSAEVVVDLLLPPLSAQIDGGNGSVMSALTAGQSRQVMCRSRDSHPPAVLVWTVNGAPMPSNSSTAVIVNKTTGISESRLHVDAAAAAAAAGNEPIDQLSISCAARNMQLPAKTAIVDTVAIPVHYAPRVKIQLGRTLDLQIIREGSDVYFDCSTNANPPAHTIKWFHQGAQLETSTNRSVVVAGASLALARVGPRQAGAYSCSAANYLATVYSEQLVLPVLYTPRCRESDTRVHYIPGETARLVCKLDARPSTVHFKWDHTLAAANSSRLQLTDFSVSGSVSTLAFSPRTDEPSVIRCWGGNSVGLQRTPCLFHLQLAELPAPPSSCRVTNQSAIHMQLVCRGGSDETAAGLQQKYQLVIKTPDLATLFVLVNGTPHFYVNNLSAGTEYSLEVSAMNARGTSQPFLLRTSTLALIPDRIAFSRRGSTRFLVEVLVASLASFMLVCLLVALMVYWPMRGRCQRRSSTSSSADPAAVCSATKPQYCDNAGPSSTTGGASAARATTLPVESEGGDPKSSPRWFQCSPDVLTDAAGGGNRHQQTLEIVDVTTAAAAPADYCTTNLRLNDEQDRDIERVSVRECGSRQSHYTRDVSGQMMLRHMPLASSVSANSHTSPVDKEIGDYYAQCFNRSTRDGWPQEAPGSSYTACRQRAAAEDRWHVLTNPVHRLNMISSPVYGHGAGDSAHQVTLPISPAESEICSAVALELLKDRSVRAAIVSPLLTSVPDHFGRKQTAVPPAYSGSPISTLPQHHQTSHYRRHQDSSLVSASYQNTPL